MKKYAIIEAEEVFKGHKGDILNDRNYTKWVQEQTPVDESEKDWIIFETLEDAEDELKKRKATYKVYDPRVKGLHYEIRLITYQIMEVFEDEEDNTILDWGNMVKITPFEIEVI